MSILEIIAENRLGASTLASHPQLRVCFEKAEQAARRSQPSDDEKARIASIVELCFEYEREPDPDERANILRTLEEIGADMPFDLPDQDIEQWEDELKGDISYARATTAAQRRTHKFLSKYFLFRAKAGLETQEAVAKKSGLTRSYIAVIETGEHFPQQKTLQKLARAFGVEVTELLP